MPPPGAHSSFDLTLKLRPEGSVPPEMLVVPGGTIRLQYPSTQAPATKIDNFLIDRHEVTNEDYKKFVDAGAYQKREFWKQPFVKDGKTISWEEAITTKVAYFGLSLGGAEGPLLAAVEKRIKAMILSSGGFRTERISRRLIRSTSYRT